MAHYDGFHQTLLRRLRFSKRVKPALLVVRRGPRGQGNTLSVEKDTCLLKSFVVRALAAPREKGKVAIVSGLRGKTRRSSVARKACERSVAEMDDCVVGSFFLLADTISRKHLVEEQ